MSHYCFQHSHLVSTFPSKFAVPTFMTIRNTDKADQLRSRLRAMDFVDDGIRFTDSQVLERIENSFEFDFPKFRNSGKVRSIPSRQYVHTSGTLFIRDIRDLKGWSILVGIENYRQATTDRGFRKKAGELLRAVSQSVEQLQAT